MTNRNTITGARNGVRGYDRTKVLNETGAVITGTEGYGI